MSEISKPVTAPISEPHTQNVRLPEFVMLGQGKAGTSLLYRELQRRKDVGLSKQKELHHFNPNHNTNEADYIAQFADQPKSVKIVGEIAPNYLFIEAIDQILETLGPKTKMIVSLRHPVDQAYSRYVQDVAAGDKNEPFTLTPTVLSRRLGRLVEVLQHLFDRVPAEQILMLQYEKDIAGVRPKYRGKVADFLGIPRRRPPKDLRGKRVNAGVMPRFLWSGNDPLDVVHTDGFYRIPRRTLVFCAQPRNSKFWRRPTRLDVSMALARQSQWTPILPEAYYAKLLEDAVLPVADQLENMLGFNMAHWRMPAKKLQYGFAPPPARFLQAAMDDLDHLEAVDASASSEVPA